MVIFFGDGRRMNHCSIGAKLNVLIDVIHVSAPSNHTQPHPLHFLTEQFCSQLFNINLLLRFRLSCTCGLASFTHKTLIWVYFRILRSYRVISKSLSENFVAHFSFGFMQKILSKSCVLFKSRIWIRNDPKRVQFSHLFLYLPLSLHKKIYVALRSDKRLIFCFFCGFLNWRLRPIFWWSWFVVIRQRVKIWHRFVFYLRTLFDNS